MQRRGFLGALAAAVGLGWAAKHTHNWIRMAGSARSDQWLTCEGCRWNRIMIRPARGRSYDTDGYKILYHDRLYFGDRT